MTDAISDVEVDGSDVVNLLSFLLGGKLVEFQRDSGAAGAMFGGPGVLRRLLQSFQGDPCGNGQYNLAIAAATRLTVPDEANSATISVEVAGARVTFDGTIVTAGAGLLFPVGTIATITGRASLTGAQFIAATAGAVLNVAYFT